MADTFYNDIAADVREPWVAKMKPQSYASFKSPVDSVVWENGLTPCTYLKCDMNHGVYPPLQQSMIDMVSKDGKPWNVELASGWPRVRLSSNGKSKIKILSIARLVEH